MRPGFSGSPRDITFSAHALTRMRERSFTTEDVFFILEHGIREMAEDDRLLHILLPSPFSCLDSTGRWTSLENCIVIAGRDGSIVTVYRADERCPFYRPRVVA